MPYGRYIGPEVKADMEALLLLGGNTGDPTTTLARAIGALGSGPGEVLAISRDHWSEPWGFPPTRRGEASDERLFLNKAVLLRTALAPMQLMSECLRIEELLGRKRGEGEGYASRPIDIDVLLIDNAVIDEPGLRVPHQHMHERLFALAPAADVAPEWIHPVLQRSVLDLLNSAFSERR